MSRLRSVFLLLTIALIQVGCAGSSTSPAADNIDADGHAQSSVPWNKPESWETTGQLGGLSQ